ncbi:MAG: molybdenum cofactor guanylyltransferase [Deltaproteobacteria bacterium]|nr:molybdenum cofactor guanylyltransferase [Deltaproteobacteria bacterium]
MFTECTGVILAGGKNSRFNGQNKAFLRLSGRRLVSPVIDLFLSLFDQVIVVTSNPLAYLEWNVMVVTDVFDVKSSLTGIHTGLFYANTPFVFVAACDTPFIRKELVSLIVSEIRPGLAAVMPETRSGVEPLLAAYSKESLPVVERGLEAGKLKIARLFKKMRVKHVSEKRVLAADPQLISLFNINTPEDLDRAAAMAQNNADGLVKSFSW